MVLMPAQAQDSVYLLMTSQGRRLKLVSTLNQCVNIFKPHLTMSEKIDRNVPLPTAPGHCPQQVGGRKEPSPPSCPSKHKGELRMNMGPRVAIHPGSGEREGNRRSSLLSTRVI